MKETPVAGKAPNEVKAPARGRAPDAAGKASLFERVPDAARLAWPDIAAILSGVVSSLSKLMGGGIVAFYAGCQLGGVAMAITFALSFVLTYLVGKITFREGLPNNVVSRLYIFGTKGSAAVGVGTVAAASVGFTVIYEAIFNMPGGTYVSAATMAAVLGGVMGSGSGAVGIIAGNFLDPYLATGVNPAALAKIIATSATIGGALPNSGAMFGMLAAMGLNHKNSYKHIAAISIGAGLCALIVMIVMANIGIV